VPAPWTLTGKGLIVVMRSKAEKLMADTRIPLDIRDTLKSPVSVLMYVDYTHSNAGPYKELLYIPGTAQFSQKLGSKRLLTISNIVVSSASSVKNGRVNWGIPKNLCNFDVAQGPENLQEISLHQDGVPQFDLAYRGKGFSFPINTGLVPGFMKPWVNDGKVRNFYTAQVRRAKPGLPTCMCCKTWAMPFLIWTLAMWSPHWKSPSFR